MLKTIRLRLVAGVISSGMAAGLSLLFTGHACAMDLDLLHLTAAGGGLFYRLSEGNPKPGGIMELSYPASGTVFLGLRTDYFLSSNDSRGLGYSLDVGVGDFDVLGMIEYRWLEKGESEIFLQAMVGARLISTEVTYLDAYGAELFRGTSRDWSAVSGLGVRFNEWLGTRLGGSIGINTRSELVKLGLPDDLKFWAGLCYRFTNPDN